MAENKIATSEALETVGKAAARKQVSVTYSELVALRDGGKLVPGMWYRITDYQCTTTDPESRAMDNDFDIVVLATGKGNLSEEARALPREGKDYTRTYLDGAKFDAWKIWYSLDNDQSRFAWADTAEGKGVIYRMIDEFNNDVPYDFKNIQFKTYAIKFEWSDYDGIDPEEFHCMKGFVGYGCRCDESKTFWEYTIDQGDEWDHLANVRIEPWIEQYSDDYDYCSSAGSQILNKIVIASHYGQNALFDSKCRNIWINCLQYDGVVFGQNCSDMYGWFAGSIESGTSQIVNNGIPVEINGGCNKIVIMSGCDRIRFESGCSCIIVRDDVKNVTVGRNVQYVTLCKSASTGLNEVVANTSGTASSPLEIEFPTGNKTVQYAGLDTEGNLRYWTPGDCPTKTELEEDSTIRISYNDVLKGYDEINNLGYPNGVTRCNPAPFYNFAIARKSNENLYFQLNNLIVDRNPSKPIKKVIINCSAESEAQMLNLIPVYKWTIADTVVCHAIQDANLPYITPKIKKLDEVILIEFTPSEIDVEAVLNSTCSGNTVDPLEDGSDGEYWSCVPTDTLYSGVPEVALSMLRNTDKLVFRSKFYGTPRIRVKFGMPGAYESGKIRISDPIVAYDCQNPYNPRQMYVCEMDIQSDQVRFRWKKITNVTQS